MRRGRPNPRTAPFGVLLVAYMPEDFAAGVAGQFDSPEIIRKALLAEVNGNMRPRVILALANRLVKVTEGKRA